MKASAAFNQRTKLFKSHSININIKIRLFDDFFDDRLLMPYLLFSILFSWNVIMDINRGNRKKTRDPRSVALQDNIEDIMGGQCDRLHSDGTN